MGSGGMTATLEAIKARRLASKELSGIANDPPPPPSGDGDWGWLLLMVIIIIFWVA